MKADELLGRNFIAGRSGDAINAMRYEAKHNQRKILAHLSALL